MRPDGVRVRAERGKGSECTCEYVGSDKRSVVKLSTSEMIAAKEKAMVEIVDDSHAIRYPCD